MTPLERGPFHHLSREERSQLTDDLLTRAGTAREDDDQHRCDELLQRVVVVNLRVAMAVAARYKGRGVPLDDLEQAACTGLTKAAAGFDPTLQHDFLSYAVPTMRGEVQRYFRDLSWSVRPPRRVQDLQWRINRAEDELSNDLGHEPSAEEVTDHLDVPRGEYDEAIAAFGCFQPPSLDQPVAGVEGDVTIGDALADESTAGDAAEARSMLSPLVRRLSERDRRILYLRFYADQTQRDIGEEFGVPQMQVSRWLSRIFRDLRDGLEGDAPLREDGRVPDRQEARAG